jgi:hypothetical protein
MNTATKPSDLINYTTLINRMINTPIPLPIGIAIDQYRSENDLMGLGGCGIEGNARMLWKAEGRIAMLAAAAAS